MLIVYVMSLNYKINYSNAFKMQLVTHEQP